MMPSVELSPQVFTRLQALATPLVDTIETVISRVLDFYDARAVVPPPLPNAGANAVRHFNPHSPPNLTHTKVLGIEFCGRFLSRDAGINWNGLLYGAVREAKARTQSAAELKQLIITPFVVGRKETEGYRYLSDIGISVQGQDANNSWKAARHIAEKLGVSLSVRFIWREKEAAAFPGVTGELSVNAN